MEFDGPLPGLPEPTIIIDSGRGFWLFWRLRSPLPVDGDNGKLTTKIKAYGRAIERVFSLWADNCWNVDRVARLPGAVNHKTKNVANVLTFFDVDYELADFPAPIFAPTPIESPPSTPSEVVGEAVSISDLPERLYRNITAPVDPSADQSERFHGVVTALTERGWAAPQIEDLASRHPNFVPARYVQQRRLRQEIGRAAGKADGRSTVVARPLAPHTAAEPYPLDYLGDVLANAARAIATKIQWPEAMAAQSVLSVASLACQALADVLMPYGQTRPLSLFALTVAASGDRKTSADNEAMAPVRMREKRLRDAHEPLARDHAVNLAAWKAQKAQIDRGKSDIDTRTRDLKALGPEPEAPLRPILTIGESTAEGLAKHMPSLPGALGIFSAEGGQFLNGHGFSDDAKLRTIASFSQLWDGQPLRSLRAGDGLTDLHGRRLAVHLLVQPNVAAGVLNDPMLRDQGFLARFLIAAPETLAGTRLWKEPVDGTEPALRRFIRMILAIFEALIAAANAAGNELTPRVLAMSDEAREAWIDFHDEVERDMGPNGPAAGLRDVAGKASSKPRASRGF